MVKAASDCENAFWHICCGYGTEAKPYKTDKTRGK
jgi:hypothetical protein